MNIATVFNGISNRWIRKVKADNSWYLRKFMFNLHHWFILHSRYTCTARKPKCGSCIIEDLYDYKEKTEE